MIVDTSAVVAILMSEPESVAFVDVMDGHTSKMSAATYLEAGIVIDSRKNIALSAELDELLRRTDTEIVAVTEAQARIARQAYRDFGRGSGHPARLNFSDCFAYALAVDTGEALLFKGDDFSHAGVRTAL